MTGNLIHESRFFTTTQAADSGVPGHLVVASRVECTALAGLTPEQAADLVQCLERAERLVQELLRPERIYVLKFGEAVPQLHFHVFPRTARLLEAYLRQVVDREPYSGARIMDWVWSHRDSVGFAAAEVETFVAAARARLGTANALR